MSTVNAAILTLLTTPLAHAQLWSLPTTHTTPPQHTPPQHTTDQHTTSQPAVARLHQFAERLRTESWVAQITVREGHANPGAHPASLPSIRIIHAGPTHPDAGAIRVEFEHLVLDASPGRLLAWHPANLTEVFIQAEPDATPIESIASVLPPFLCPPLALAQTGDPSRLPLLNAPDTPRIDTWTTPDPNAEAFVIELTGQLTPPQPAGPAAVRVTLDDAAIINYTLLDAAGQPAISLDIRTIYADLGLPQAPDPDSATRLDFLDQLAPLRPPLTVGRALPPVPYVGVTNTDPSVPASPRNAFTPTTPSARVPDALLLITHRVGEHSTDTAAAINTAITQARRQIARAAAANGTPPDRRARFIARPLLVVDQAADPTDAPAAAREQWGTPPPDAYLEPAERALPDLYWTPATREFADATNAILVLSPDATVTALIPLADPTTGQQRPPAELADAITQAVTGSPRPAPFILP